MFGWLGRIFGGPAEGRPRVRWREGMLPDEGIRVAQAYLEAVASLAELEAPVVVAHASEHCAELRAKVAGLPLRVVVDFTGDVRDFAIKYADSRSREYIDIEYDPEDAGQAGAQLEAWEEADRKIYLGRQIYVEGSNAEVEAAAFQALPADLRQRVLTEVERLRVRYFRSRRDEHENTLWDGADEVAQPVEWLASLIRLSADVAIARGAEAPGTRAAPPPPNSYAAADDDGAKREAAEAMARSIALRIPGARVVERKPDSSWDVRWTEGSAHLRVVLDYRFGDLEAHARADGVQGEFSLVHDPEVTLEDAPPNDDGWDEVDCYIFFDKSTFVTGPKVQALREASMLRALPKELLDELLASCAELANAPDLENSNLHVAVSDLEQVTDDGAQAVAVARLYGRVVTALPVGPPATAGGDMRCRYCGAIWFPSAGQPTCARCGGPA